MSIELLAQRIEKFKNEKTCKHCECLFLWQEGEKEDLCRSCAKLPDSVIGSKEKVEYVHQDIVTQLRAQLEAATERIEKLEGSQKSTPKKEYSKKCKDCNQVFVSEHPATLKCDSCRETK